MDTHEQGATLLAESFPSEFNESPPPDASATASPDGTDPRGSPWVDFLPDFTHQSPDTWEGRCAEFLRNLSEGLAAKELLKLATVNQKIHRSYYRMWVYDSNDLMRGAVRLKHRMAKLKKT